MQIKVRFSAAGTEDQNRGQLSFLDCSEAEASGCAVIAMCQAKEKERPLPKKTVVCLLAQHIPIMPHSIHPFLLSLEPQREGSRLLTTADRDTQMLDPVVHFCSFFLFHSVPLFFFASSLSGHPIKQIGGCITNCTGSGKMAIAANHKNRLENVGQVSSWKL